MTVCESNSFVLVCVCVCVCVCVPLGRRKKKALGCSGGRELEILANQQAVQRAVLVAVAFKVGLKLTSKPAKVAGATCVQQRLKQLAPQFSLPVCPA